MIRCAVDQTQIRKILIKIQTTILFQIRRVQLKKKNLKNFQIVYQKDNDIEVYIAKFIKFYERVVDEISNKVVVRKFIENNRLTTQTILKIQYIVHSKWNLNEWYNLTSKVKIIVQKKYKKSKKKKQKKIQRTRWTQ